MLFLPSQSNPNVVLLQGARLAVSLQSLCCGPSWPQSITTWVHDIGIDVNAFAPLAAAEKGVHVITEVLKGLQAKGLVASMRKSGFVVSDAQTAKDLKSLLKHFPEYPQVRDSIKDLGMDRALGRKRRVGTHLSVLPKGHVAWGASNCCPLLPARNLST